MSKSVSNSIDELVNELQARIDLFKSSLVSSNISLNQENLINLEKIVKNYTETSLDNLSILDLYSFSLIDIKKILKIIGRNDDYIEETINLLKNNGNDISVYETILKMITEDAKSVKIIENKKNKVSIKDFIPVLFFILIFVVIVIAGYYFLNTIDLMSLIS